MGRSTSGVRIQRIKGEDDRVSSCAIVPAEEEVDAGAVADGAAPAAAIEAPSDEQVDAVEEAQIDAADDADDADDVLEPDADADDE